MCQCFLAFKDSLFELYINCSSLSLLSSSSLFEWRRREIKEKKKRRPNEFFSLYFIFLFTVRGRAFFFWFCCCCRKSHSADISCRVCIWQAETKYFFFFRSECVRFIFWYIFLFIPLRFLLRVLYFSETQSLIRCHGSYIALANIDLFVCVTVRVRA